MKKDKSIDSILIIGSGPIVIGQGCEFDYSCAQALKSLKEEGYRVILVNSNPASIMTDPELADATYIEPMSLDYLEQIIAQERPSALIPTLGGQVSLNAALQLHEAGVLEKYQIKLLGASYQAIQIAENRKLFQAKMQEIGLKMPKSLTIENEIQIDSAIETLGLPLMIRSSFTLGGSGARLAYTREQALEGYQTAKIAGENAEVNFDEALIGWKEFELEVVRDKNDNCIVVCGIENFDPLGIHTGDSITVAPIQTLSDKDYQLMRDAAFNILRVVGIETGGSNVQFAMHPKTGELKVIEMNPRVSRSSALVSKATGFPIAKIATQLALGYTLDELKNEITGGTLPASFEPSIDYVVIKIPRFDDAKFNALDLARGPQMRSIGEVMAIGSTFKESLQQAMCSLEIGSYGFDLLQEKSDLEIQQILQSHSSLHLYAIGEGFRRGFSLETLYALSFVDPWFLKQIQSIIQAEDEIKKLTLQDLNQDYLIQFKQLGFSDQRLSSLLQVEERAIRGKRLEQAVFPVYKKVDSCAGEFAAKTAYLYSCYQEYCESKISDKPKIMVIGSGPNRIGQGIEFDYICVKAIKTFSKKGFETIMLNCNPETVSTDYDIADKLYFVPLTYEKVMDIIEKEKVDYVALQFGGQTPLNLADQLGNAGVQLIGLDAEMIHLTENRSRFSKFLQHLNLQQPKNISVDASANLKTIIKNLRFPLILRPSFILGGTGMSIAHEFDDLVLILDHYFKRSNAPVLVEEFLSNAIELDVDAISDGQDVFIPLCLEHIEALGIHSGDSACVTSPYKIQKNILNLIRDQTRKIGQSLKIKGLFNIQFAVKDQQVFIIEVNLRASRTSPFIAKATGLPLIDIAVKVMLGESLLEQGYLASIELPYYCVKEAVLPFKKFIGTCTHLGPEMRSTGEVMGIGQTPYEAYLKSQIAAGGKIPRQPGFRVLLSGVNPAHPLKRMLKKLSCIIDIELNLKQLPRLLISLDKQYIDVAIAHNIYYISTAASAEFFLESLILDSGEIKVKSLQSLYTQLKYLAKN